MFFAEHLDTLTEQNQPPKTFEPEDLVVSSISPQHLLVTKTQTFFSIFFQNKEDTGQDLSDSPEHHHLENQDDVFPIIQFSQNHKNHHRNPCKSKTFAGYNTFFNQKFYDNIETFLDEQGLFISSPSSLTSISTRKSSVSLKKMPSFTFVETGSIESICSESDISIQDMPTLLARRVSSYSSNSGHQNRPVLAPLELKLPTSELHPLKMKANKSE